MHSDQQGRPAFERLEARMFLSAAPYQHVLIISVDGLHQADVTDPALKQSLANILALKAGGVSYAKAHTTHPSDSFPGTLAYLTGAGPGTTGVFYDVSYSRALLPPGSDTSAAPGTVVAFDESADKNSDLLSGGGNFDASSLDPNKLPVDSHGHVVYPHNFLKVNTIFNVAHNAGLHTAFSDKHPAYDIANGPGGDGVDDFYAPEINSLDALLDPATGKTVNADALLAADPFTDVSKYKLVDPSTDPVGPKDPTTGFSTDPNLQDPTTNFLLTERYDDLKVTAILNEINGLNSRGTHAAAVPNLFGFNFQAVSVAQKFFQGGIDVLPNGKEGSPSNVLKAAIQHTDASVGKIVDALKAMNLWSSTLIALTAKHGQNPRVGVGGVIKDNLLTDVLAAAKVNVAAATQDDVSLLWLQDQSQTAQAVSALNAFVHNGTVDVFFQGTKKTLPASSVISQVLSDKALEAYQLGNPAHNDRTPDVIVTLRPGYILVGNPAKFQFKRAEHGGFSEDDVHVPLILDSGNVAAGLRGQVVQSQVDTSQLAVTALRALGLDSRQLQGAVIEHTQPLPVTLGKGRQGDLVPTLTGGDTEATKKHTGKALSVHRRK